MGYLYIKVIESKKVAVRSSFFINYPFIRLRIGKEKKDTNFKPGVEWWDKIYAFKDVNPDPNMVLIAQARDKSIHVFGSDWLGEIKVQLADLMDGKVHQQWYKLGRGNKNHSRAPRGYLHLAFHYFDSHPNGKRPFSTAPVESVAPFEDWLANNQRDENSFFATNTSAVNPSSAAERLRKSDPAETRDRYDDSPEMDKKKRSPLSQKDKSKSANQISKSVRPRSNTVPTNSRSVADEESDEDSNSSYEESEAVPTANLIDLSLFDSPKKKSTGQSKSTETGIDIFNKESPVRFSPKTAPNHSTTTKEMLPSASAPADILQKLNQDPTFDAWYSVPKDAHVSYNPKNPFLSNHDSTSPAFSVQK